MNFKAVIRRSFIMTGLYQKLSSQCNMYEAITTISIAKTFSHGYLLAHHRLHHHLRVQKELKGKYKHWVHRYPDAEKAEKYVYEDIAIASYLICLWKLEDDENELKFQRDGDGDGDGTRGFRRRQQRFVDIGAGNGFLTFLLSSEGFEGYGIDSQLRKTWHMFDTETTKCDLRHVSLEAHRETFPDVDW